MCPPNTEKENKTKKKQETKEAQQPKKDADGGGGGETGRAESREGQQTRKESKKKITQRHDHRGKKRTHLGNATALVKKEKDGERDIEVGKGISDTEQQKKTKKRDKSKTN